MAFPQSAEYDEAIQNSRSAFLDDELRNATNDGPVFMGVPGGPVGSGNFAIVYRFRTGTRRIAVKCFTRETKDQRARYQLIHEHLAAKRMPWTIDFTFVEEGIRVKGKTYPIVKMEWIENAKTLLSHINETLLAKQPIDSVCDQFYRMTSDLRSRSIAHGDLQHANLIMSNGKLLLIDYDGMCVPKTVGLKSEEDGLPDYQHPCRNGGTLQSTLDHFSTLVIWTSLRALTIDPTLWSRWVRDDERLLFRRSDFIRPENSALIRELLSFGDPKMSCAVEAIVKASAATRLEQVPHLVEVVADVASLDTTPWWQTKETASTASALQGNNGPQLPAWIEATTTAPLPPVVFRGSTTILSSYSAISMASALILVLLGTGGAVHAPMALICVTGIFSVYAVVLHLVFLKRYEVASMHNAERGLSRALEYNQKAANLLRFNQTPYFKSIADQERKIADSEAKISSLESSIDEIKRRAAEKLRAIERELTDKRVRIEKTERDAVSQSHAKRTSAKAHYDSNLRQIDQELNSAETRYATNVNLLSSQAERDREAKLAAKFDVFVQSEMAKIEIWRNNVSGVNSSELRQCGFHTLADFVGIAYGECLKHRDGKSYKVRGIGWARAEQMEKWRKSMIENIRLKIPSAEREAINLAIDAETRTERARLASNRDQARAKANDAKSNAKTEYDKLLAQAMRDESAAQQLAKVQQKLLSTENAALKAKISADEAAESGSLTRELWALQSVVNPARHRIQAMRAKMQAECSELSRDAAKAHANLRAAKLEVARYAAITHVGLLKHVFS